MESNGINVIIIDAENEGINKCNMENEFFYVGF
jgi:hypothetical protein